MKALFLGAGASIDAGYPGTSRLLDTIKSEITSGADEATKESWRRFDTFRKSATDPLAVHILNSPNPEVVLSYPDLLVAALHARDTESDKRLHEAYRRADQAAVNRIAEEREAPEREALKQGSQARHDLLHCLHSFLSARHGSDAREEASAQREYLRRELSWLSPGDVIITTNWDTLAERILAEDLLWSPTDGYGLPMRIVHTDSSSALPDWFPTKSAVRVLKLHGSFGWHALASYCSDDRLPADIFLDFDEFLAQLPYRRGDEWLFVRDVSEPRLFQPANEPLLIYPSFLKLLAGRGVQTVWEEARGAIESASEVRIIGASLPDSDTALRSLLNRLRFRTAEITVHNPEAEAHTRWRDFLGDQIVCKCLRAGESDSPSTRCS